MWNTGWLINYLAEYQSNRVGLGIRLKYKIEIIFPADYLKFATPRNKSISWS